MRTVVFDIDTQHDFMDPGGRLYVPGAESIVPLLRRILEAARDRGVPVVASVDAHAPDDPEFAGFPPHCVRGTPGQEKIPATVFGPFRLVSAHPEPLAGLEAQPWVRLEKQTLSLFENANARPLLAALQPESCVVVGVATEHCVRAAALGLRRHCARVAVVTDAVRAVDPAAGERALDELRAAGIETIDASTALGRLARATPYPGRDGGGP